MKWMRIAALTCLTCVLAASAPISLAQEDPAESEEKKGGFWGDHFALFLEVATGTSQPDGIDPSLATGTRNSSWNSLSFDDFDYARAAIGWTLPHDRGNFSIVFTGYDESGYNLSARGEAYEYITGGGSISAPEPTFPILWWELDIGDGVLTSTGSSPTWLPIDDVNGNEIPDPEEIRYDPEGINTATKAVTDTLQNQFQTVDVLYGRKFGGRRLGGRWAAGMRHFEYTGNIPAAAWLGVGLTGTGYTDGHFILPLVFYQEASGTGPTGSLGIVYSMFREKLVVYAEGRIAFLIQSLDSDSGDFFTIVNDPETGNLRPLNSRLQNSIDKDVWNVGFEAGMTYIIGSGLSLEVAYHVQSYQDTILLPTRLSIPETVDQILQPTSAIYNTQDIMTDGFRAGLKFQF